MKLTIHSLLLSMLLLAVTADELLPPEIDMPTNPNDTTPVCGDDEELFQLRMAILEGDINVDYATYRVVTANEVHNECVNCVVRQENPTDVRLCLPRDGCHTAFIGRWRRYTSCFQGEGGQELLVTWGEETLRRSNSWLFDKIDFGDGCPTQPSVCDQDREMLFEFFADRGHFQRYYHPYALSWHLIENLVGDNDNDNDNGIPNKVVIHLDGREQDQESSFVYETACVPRNACLEFSVWDSDLQDYYDTSPISVRLDGKIYSEGELRFGGSREVFKRTIKLGGTNCTVASCNAASEDLFAMEYKVTRASEYMCSNNPYFRSSSAVESWTAPQFALMEDNDTSSDYYFADIDYSGFEINQTYVSLACIPNNECAVFRIDSEYNGDFSYRLFQNGAELTQREVHDEYFSRIEGGTTTMAGVCAGASTLSLEGIMVSSTMAVFALLAVWL